MKSRFVAAAMGFFGGSFGLHKVYIGSKNCVRTALLSTVFSWTGIPAFAGVIQSVRYLFMSESEFNEYVLKQKLGADVILINSNDISYNAIQNNMLQQRDSSKQCDFTNTLYTKLLLFSHEINTNISQLKSDTKLLNELKNNPQQINNCVVYDMVQIFGMLFGNSCENKQLEAFCCFLLLPNANSNLIKTKSFSALQIEYNAAKYNSIINDTVISYINMDNPLFINLLENVNANVSTALSLPMVLSKTDKKLFDAYAGILHKYMEILVTANGIADINEQNNMHQINKIIYEN